MNVSDVANDNNHTLKHDGDATKFIQISPESIVVYAESAGYSNIPDVVSKSLAEDTSYRLRELIQVTIFSDKFSTHLSSNLSAFQSCVQILRHNKRQRLGVDDVTVALHRSDVPTLYGQLPQPTEFDKLHNLDIYAPVDKKVNLSHHYAGCDAVEVYSPLALHVQFLSPDLNEDKSKLEIYSWYYEKICQSLLSTADNVFQV